MHKNYFLATEPSSTKNIREYLEEMKQEGAEGFSEDQLAEAVELSNFFLQEANFD